MFLKLQVSRCLPVLSSRFMVSGIWASLFLPGIRFSCMTHFWKYTINFDTPTGYLSNVHGVSSANVRLINRILMLVRVAMPRSTSRCSVRLLWKNGLLAPINNTDGNVTIVCTHFARNVTQGQFTPSQWLGTRMGCIIALNVDSHVAVVVGNLVQPRVPDCINGSKNTFAKSAKLTVRT